MSEEEAVSPIVSDADAVKFPDTITVKTSQVLAYQAGTERRIARQVESINRVLGLLEESQQREAAAADEIARLSRALGEEQAMYQDQKALLDRAREERDEVLTTFSEMMTLLKKAGLEFHTREGDQVASMAPKESFSVDPDWDRASDLALDPEAVVDADALTPLPASLPVGEERPGRHLAGG